MENLMLFFIILGIASPFLALSSFFIPNITAFFMKKPTKAKAAIFWFATSLIASLTVAYLRGQLN